MLLKNIYILNYSLFPDKRNQRSELTTTDSKDTGPKAKVSVKLDGIMFDFDLAYEGQSIS